MAKKVPQAPRPRILLVHDDNLLRQYLFRQLSRAGYEVHSFGNGLEACHTLGTDYFDLLCTTLEAPGMDGVTLARQGNEADPDMKVMFITGFSAVELAEVPGTSDKVISKPFGLRELVPHVKRFLAA